MPRRSPPPRRRAAPIADQPWPLTFFLTTAERRLVLRALRRIDIDRARALQLALGVHAPSAPARRGGEA